MLSVVLTIGRTDIRNAILTSTVNPIPQDSLQMPSSLMEAHYETLETIARRL